jgi:hypothetical protein
MKGICKRNGELGTPIRLRACPSKEDLDRQINYACSKRAGEEPKSLTCASAIEHRDRDNQHGHADAVAKRFEQVDCLAKIARTTLTEALKALRELQVNKQ